MPVIAMRSSLEGDRIPRPSTVVKVGHTIEYDPLALTVPSGGAREEAIARATLKLLVSHIPKTRISTRLAA